MNNGIKRMTDFYNFKQDAGIYQTEFFFLCKDKWKEQGYIDDNTDLNKLFAFDEPGELRLSQLGWCEAQFCPEFPEEIIEDRGETELVRDNTGRSVVFFKGRRSGFMPHFVDHPVKDMKTWEESCKWRLDPSNPDRYKDLKERMDYANQCKDSGMFIIQDVIGGYMFLRSLMGPEETLYMFYDDPDLIHELMQTWLTLCDGVIAKHQEYIELDELFLAEDICYNHGSLISPEYIREFLFPYYQQLINNIKARQKGKRLGVRIDTDGYLVPVIDLYKEIGMTHMVPFEVASGCDVVEIGRMYPDLLMRGGFDKRILAEGFDAIDREIDRIMPVMKKRGGYIPTCDHGVPPEVSFENYVYYRQRMSEYK